VRPALLLLLLAACPRPQQKAAQSVTDVNTPNDTDADRRQRLIAELEDELITSYDRDELPDIETTLVQHAVGPARIGVGPGDVYYGDSMRRVSSRWPLRLDSTTPALVRSKRLDIHLSNDKQVTAAWISDEISWRMMFCGRTAVIPLRLTALYAHDGDRWVEVFEHLSYAQLPHAETDGRLVGAPITPAFSPGFKDTLSKSLWPVLRFDRQRLPEVVALDPTHVAESDPTKPAPSLFFAPDPDGEWHGDEDVEKLQLVDGTLSPDDARIGTVGRSPASATIAYWVGNFTAQLQSGGKVRLRGTFVFERRDGRWIVVQGHLSQPILDNELAVAVFGTALLSADLSTGEALAIDCDDGRRARATPAAVQ
jgi:hypothetical protein